MGAVPPKIHGHAPLKTKEMDISKITKKQLQTAILEAVLSKKKWYEKKNHLIKMFNHWKNIGIEITEDNLENFIDACKQEDKRRKRVFFAKSQSGEIQSIYTPCEKMTNPYGTIRNPVIGVKYHLSWAFKNCHFKLIRLDDDGIHCYMDNPKNKRKELLKCKITDLRKLR